MEMTTKIKFVQIDKHKAQMIVEKLIKESKFTVEGQVSKIIWKHQEVGEYTCPGRPTTITKKQGIQSPYLLRT